MRRVAFPSYAAAVTFVVNRKLGIDQDEEYEIFDFPEYYRWEPVRLIRKIYRPGHGTVVLKKEIAQ